MGEADGLIFGLRVDGEGRAQDVTLEALARPEPDTGFVWLHLDAESDGAAAWMAEASGLDPITQDALLAEETRPRCETHGDALTLLLRGVNLTPGTEPDDMVSLRIHVEPHRLLTLRRRPVRTPEEVRAALSDGRVDATVGDLLVAITDQLTRHIGDTIEEIEDRADALEEQVLSTGTREMRSEISDLRRVLISMRRYLAPQREALTRIGAERLTWLDDRHRGRIREIADRTIRHLEEIDSAREHAAVAYEELAGRLTERVEQRMYLLSIVAAIFLPLGFVTGLLGINVGGIPGAEAPRAFTYVAGGCLTLALLLLLVMRRRGWL